MLEEARESAIEGIGLLEVREMAGAGYDDVFGATDGLVHLLAERRRRKRVLVADDDQRWHVKVRQQRRRIGPRHERRNRIRNRFGRAGEDEVAHLLGNLWPRPARVLAKELRDHFVSNRRRPFV